MRPPVVAVVGAGQGGFQAAASLREGGFDGSIVLIGDEACLPYQRPPLSKSYLAGHFPLAELWLRPQSFFDREEIDYLAGETVAAIDRPSRSLRLASGREIRVDHVVLATGARCRPLPVPGADLDGVFVLRTLADTDLLRERLSAARAVVVVGAGFIGLEFAAVARAAGVAVAVVEVTQTPMGRVVSAETSRFYTEAHRGWGAELLLGTGVARILGREGRAEAVETGDGRRLPADLVLVCIGVVPNTELAAGAGLAVANGIVVDEELKTADPAIFAIGDCANFPTRFAAAPVRLESVQNCVDQARSAAAHLLGKPAPFDKVPWFWSDQRNLKLQIAGLTIGHDRAVLRGDPESGAFSVFCFRGGRLLGVESVNRPLDHMIARRLLAGTPTLSPEQAADPDFDLKAHAAGRPAR
ncbi:MAG TPA: FAD-dependent oxidoreductase [Stellaceae bacterium]|nr:FAD-dependent oxidoreductase [Stellaceae bacterium]